MVTGILIGLVLAPLSFFRGLIAKSDFRTCLVLAAATLAIASVATTVGTALPKVLKIFKADPGEAAAMIQVIMDIAGVVVGSFLLPHGIVFLGASMAELWQEVKEVLVAELTNSGVSPERQSQVWFNLGCAQQTRGGLDAAERSFGRAFRSCPAATTATDAALRQALLLAKKAETIEASALLQEVLQREPKDLGARWNLGLLQVHEGDLKGARASLQQAIETTKQLGLSPRRLAMMYEPDVYTAELKDEESSFEAYAPELSPTLRELRGLVSKPSWLLSWAVETVQVFGPDVTSASYGETFFKSWKAVMDHPEMQDLVHKYEASAVILGSALGYTCLFFAAAGIPCTGYDLLEESMVKMARRYVEEAPVNVSVEFEAKDAFVAPLTSRFQASTGPSILWLNDEVWPSELRLAVKERAALELVEGSLVISYGPQEVIPASLVLVASLRVSTSWCRKEELSILKLQAT
eukprot:symbB.v1.2.019356.t1/scaffold1564.1/size111405/7